MTATIELGGWAESAAQQQRQFSQALAWPFDTARAQYAQAVRAGLIERSMLAQRDFEQTLGLFERLTLGPWARSV
ncbi:MAG: hypothetical protein RJA44_39 [Pseudomonadota bacterium]|jgi:hypothetical protein